MAKKFNVDDFNPVVEAVPALKRTNASVVALVEKCKSLFEGIKVGESFVVDKKFLAPITLKAALREAITPKTGEYLTFRVEKDDNKAITGTRVIKTDRKPTVEEEADNTETSTESTGGEQAN